MYEAIVLLPLLGAVIAGIVCLVGARNRFPGEDPPPPADDHAAAPVHEDHPRAAAVPHAEHGASANTHGEASAHAPSAAGSLLAELTTSTFLVISCVLSWFALFDVGIAGHEARIAMFSFISFADLHSEWMLRIDALTAVMLVVVTTISSL
ncbi:MAG: NADH-quinone oxidoreductase subunit L, partial [Rhizobiales bacterium]|nr:NADH-quinone oxidoreductase subunit L [Hyphomicrobiales bacterium]